VRRGLIGAAGPGRKYGPRRLSDVGARSLNFTVRRRAPVESVATF
jgi:hypothetical protein